ncbi:MAG: ARPP-1 family domain-containing protein [Candidatus Helarchaeota archaeon]
MYLSELALEEFRNEFGNLELEEPEIINENIAIIPIIDNSISDNPRSYITAEEVENFIKFKDSGNINVVKVVNDYKTKVLLVSGTIVESKSGETQDRVILETILIPAHSTVSVPCRCVHASHPISHGSGFAYSYRAHVKMTKMTICGNSSVISQGKIWQEVKAVESSLKASRALPSSYRSDRLSTILSDSAEKIKNITQKIKPKKNQIGIMVIFGDEVLGIEIVDSPISYKNIHFKILNSFIENFLIENNKKLDIDNAIKKKMEQLKKASISKNKRKIIKEAKDIKCEILLDEDSDNVIIHRCY